MENVGVLAIIIIGIFIIIFAILLILMPLFVMQIRNEMLKLNKNMVRVIELLEIRRKAVSGNPPAIPSKYKICSHCGGKNRLQDYVCVHCSKPLI